MTRSEEARQKLTAIIREKIASEGEISFRDFMDTALYHPALGYYTSSRNRIGWEGDYYTSPDVHSIFGTSIMKQLSEMMCLLEEEKSFHVVEVGAGKGNLCADILKSARKREPSIFKSMRYAIVEKSPALIEAQRASLSAAGLADKVSWPPDIEAALENIDNAVILSNELIDAFPVHRVAFDGMDWREVYVTADDGGFTEVTKDLSGTELESFLSKLEGPFNEGYTTEVNLDAMRWIRDTGRSLKRGFVITIDYGYPRGDYYSPLRSGGTLLCYHKHSVCEDPYARVGEEDITAHVDFTSIAEAGEEAGLKVSGFCEQFHFLMGLGIFDEFQSGDGIEFCPQNYRTFQENLAIKKLLMPESMGGTFKVLIQHKGMEKPNLRAFSFKDLSHRL